MTLRQQHLDALSHFQNYDWTSADTLFPPNERVVEAMHDLAQHPTPATAATDVTRLYKAGAYAMHHEKAAPMAASLLGQAYDGLQQHPAIKGEFVKSGDIYRIGNNLAYALVNRKDLSGEAAHMALMRAEDLIRDTTEHTKDMRTRSFAWRVGGQVDFARAAMKDDFQSAYALVQRGVRKCIEGTQKLTMHEDLPEVARTYNNNAAQLLKLAQKAPQEKQSAVLLESYLQIQAAADLWKKESMFDDEFGVYKKTTANIAADIQNFAKQKAINLEAMAAAESRTRPR